MEYAFVADDEMLDSSASTPDSPPPTPQDAELLDAEGLGGFGWLIQAVGMALPEPLARLAHGVGRT